MRLIIADDHRIVREGLVFMLSDEPHIEIVGEADGGDALLDLLDEVEADVVLLDVRMPGMSGLEALDEVSRRHPDVKVVMLTMHDDASFVRRAIQGGAAGYLLKSSGKSELRRALDEVTSGKSYMQSEVTGRLFQDIAEGQAPVVLDERQREVLQLIADGLANREIAARLGVSEATVKTDLRTIFEGLGAESRAEAVAIGLRRGLIS